LSFGRGRGRAPDELPPEREDPPRDAEGFGALGRERLAAPDREAEPPERDEDAPDRLVAPGLGRRTWGRLPELAGERLAPERLSVFGAGRLARG
jgi:hypothetical protein